MGLTLGLLAGLAVAIAKMVGSRSHPRVELGSGTDDPWPRLHTDPAVPEPPRVALVPDPAAPSPVAPVVPEAVVVPEPAPSAVSTTAAAPLAPAAPAAPVAKRAPATKNKKPLTAPWVEPTEGTCPTSHPVKAKLSSRIFHLPGMFNYERTRPDRCYRDPAAAESDGLRAAKK